MACVVALTRNVGSNESLQEILRSAGVTTCEVPCIAFGAGRPVRDGIHKVALAARCGCDGRLQSESAQPELQSHLPALHLPWPEHEFLQVAVAQSLPVKPA